MSEISDREFLGFKWPPKMPSYSFRRKKANTDITWVAYVYPNNVLTTIDTQPVVKFGFSSQAKAKKWKEETEATKSKPLVIVAPIYGTDEDGWAL